MSTATVFDVAKYFIKNNNGCLTAIKLQKLCYYAQAWSLAWDDEPLFESEFYAWVNGPVCAELYNIHRGKYWVETQDIEPYGDENNLNNNQIETCKVIQEGYGRFSGTQLSVITHHEKPWLDARKGLGPKEPSTVVISKEAMKEFYASLSDINTSEPIENLELPAWII